MIAPALLSLAALFAAAEPPPRPLLDVMSENGLEAGLAWGVLHPHSKVEVVVLPLSSDKWQNRSHLYTEPAGPHEVCGLKVINPGFRRADMLHAYTTIPEKYLQDPGGPDLNFARALLHEARHCGQYGMDELAGEMDSDLYSVNALAGRPGAAQEARTLRHMRAVAAFTGPGWSHATALALEARERGAAIPPFQQIAAGNRRVYEKLWAANVLDPIMHGLTYEPHGDQLKAVYRHLKVLLAARELDFDPYAKRAAELYIEGLDALAPTLLLP